MRGEMLWFNEAKNYGFISTDEGERLYVPGAGFLPGKPPEGRCAGLKVAFEREEAEDGNQAFAVTLVQEAVGGRARRHRANRG
ncbi:MAG: Cold-shock DNA-binding domain [Gaiellaceae bacterium]|jgi:cold shock CspA family protein|nr:Cold-shock DNA-binding domain [Gaiellaceae bacterium]